MASATATEHYETNLDHVFFSMDPIAPSRPMLVQSAPDTPQSNTISRAVSPSLGSSSEDQSTSSTSSSTTLNPAANSFKPKSASFSPPLTATRHYEPRKAEGKGLGLFATGLIPIGTRIICEAPLVHIPENALHLAWGPYCRLPDDQKKAFDTLHLFKPEHLDPEQVSRLYLIDANDESLDKDDIEEMVNDQGRVMNTFACNNFQCGRGLAVFETASRLNHSCTPNVHHSWNPTIRKLTVHAVRDIHPGEELCTTYLGGPGAYYVRATRIELLRSNYGFTCTCSVCADITGLSESRRTLMGQIAYGLQMYQYGGQGQEFVPYVPSSPVMALKQAEDLICMLMDEGVLSIELCKAYRMAATVALAAKDWGKAQQYALDEADAERNCLGTQVDDLIKNGAAAICWIEQVRKCLVKAGIFQPEQKLRRRKEKSHDAQKSAKKKERQARAKAEKNAKFAAERAAKELERARRIEEMQAQMLAKEEARKAMEYAMSFPAL